mmetsp:Transcript_12663/g.37199  ORF Transcript_12663/g.37199 Transcript_12663/m.37199 type:complete len:200 (+) Transcript_12663:768-1367(+)
MAALDDAHARAGHDHVEDGGLGFELVPVLPVEEGLRAMRVHRPSPPRGCVDADRLTPCVVGGERVTQEDVLRHPGVARDGNVGQLLGPEHGRCRHHLPAEGVLVIPALEVFPEGLDSACILQALARHAALHARRRREVRVDVRVGPLRQPLGLRLDGGQVQLSLCLVFPTFRRRRVVKGVRVRSPLRRRGHAHPGERVA